LIAPADGSLWLIPVMDSEQQQVVRWEDGKGQIVFARGRDTSVAVDQLGRAWVLRQGVDQLEMWEEGAWTTFGNDQGWVTGRAERESWWASSSWQAITDNQGRVWLSTQGDMRSFDGDCWTLHSRVNMIFEEPEWPEISIVHRLADGKGDDQIWLAECQYGPLGPESSGGLRRYNGRHWRGADAPRDPACISSIAVGPRGELWAGTIDVIWHLQPETGEWTLFQLPEATEFGGNFSYLTDLVTDEAGEVWAIVQICGGANCDFLSYLYRLRDGQGSVILEPSDWWQPPKDLFQGDDGRIWLLWEGVFYQIDGEILKPIAALNPRGITVDPFGRVWALVGQKQEAALWVLDLPAGD
jgi:hypothetical protein